MSLLVDVVNKLISRGFWTCIGALFFPKPNMDLLHGDAQMMQMMAFNSLKFRAGQHL